MERNSVYYRQVQLLLRVLPIVAQEPCFAVKGGTAINLFVRDIPRLSVDIDLVYLEEGSREVALTAIRAALDRIANSILNSLEGARITKSYAQSPDTLRLNIEVGRTSIKVELSPVLRGLFSNRYCDPYAKNFSCLSCEPFTTYA